MEPKTYHFNGTVRGERFSITNHELLKYAEYIRLNDVAEGRYSWLFALDVMMVEGLYGVDSYHIVSEIRAMEQGKSGWLTKAATQFRREPLKGLWHKHYFSPHFIPHNVLSEMAGDKMRKLAKELFDPAKSEVVTQEMISEFSHRVAIDSYERRGDDERLTGEWIVFAKHKDENYYLCLSTHNAGDDTVAQKIEDVCCPQFPFLCNKNRHIAQQKIREGHS